MDQEIRPRPDGARVAPEIEHDGALILIKDADRHPQDDERDR
jgi:hypothetical protein